MTPEARRASLAMMQSSWVQPGSQVPAGGQPPPGYWTGGVVQAGGPSSVGRMNRGNPWVSTQGAGVVPGNFGNPRGVTYTGQAEGPEVTTLGVSSFPAVGLTGKGSEYMDSSDWHDTSLSPPEGPSPEGYGSGLDPRVAAGLARRQTPSPAPGPAPASAPSMMSRPVPLGKPVEGYGARTVGPQSMENQSVPAPMPQQQTMADLKPTPTTVAGAAASASRTLLSRRKGGAGGKGKAAVAGPAAHKASPSWRERIMQAASHGDVYMRKMHDVLIRARRSAAANRGQGLAPFVPVRDYKHNKMILVVDDGTDFVFDMNSRKGQAEYKKALAQAGYSGQKLSKYADAASSELAHIATYGESEEQAKAARLEAEQSMQAGVANINDEADLKTMMAQLAEVN